MKINYSVVVYFFILVFFKFHPVFSLASTFLCLQHLSHSVHSDTFSTNKIKTFDKKIVLKK